MADAKKETKHYDYAKMAHKNLDEVMKHILETHHPGIEDSFKDYENFTNEKHSDHVMANILAPSFDEFYNTVKKEIGSKFAGKDGKADGGASLHKKEKEVKAALAKGMLAYMKKARPELHKTLMKLVKEDKLDEYYDLIAHHMDTSVLGLDARRGGLYSSLAKQMTDSEDATVNKLLVNLDRTRGRTTNQAWNYLVGKKTAATVGKYDAITIGAYLKDKVIGKKESGFTVAKEIDFLKHDVDDLMRVYHGVTKGVWQNEQGEQSSPEAYHLKSTYQAEAKKSKEKKP